MKETTPIFILGSGRSGTFQMVKMLENESGIEAHHEYLFEQILKPSVLYRMGVVKDSEILSALKNTHVPAVHYSEARIWLDSSNALPWITKPLYELFPTAKFIHLVRDGRKVVSSFYNKFSDVMYDDRSVAIVNAWLDDPESVIEPSAEKKYWRPLPVQGERYFSDFDNYNRFQKLSYYWQDCNTTIQKQLSVVPDSQKVTLRLEDVVSEPAALAKFLRVFEIDFGDRFMETLKRPVNVAEPKNYLLSDEQSHQFYEIAGDAMSAFGYEGEKEYSVEY